MHHQQSTKYESLNNFQDHYIYISWLTCTLKLLATSSKPIKYRFASTQYISLNTPHCVK